MERELLFLVPIGKRRLAVLTRLVRGTELFTLAWKCEDATAASPYTYILYDVHDWVMFQKISQILNPDGVPPPLTYAHDIPSEVETVAWFLITASQWLMLGYQSTAGDANGDLRIAHPALRYSLFHEGGMRLRARLGNTVDVLSQLRAAIEAAHAHQKDVHTRQHLKLVWNSADRPQA